ncbi:hypothetical protein AmFV_007 [Apis mellifera filamentous virus]|uniref:hypothetical protein n=1 Tax=Apis mellifera filamentous virus TaxID=1100043 RepID=UPI0006BDA91E|nr:hypothetical protein APL35_gp007 [Apis mellifera filamentous virus]UQL06508.1 hypothetical protein AmFV_007 [Apis mellifera filamentous virus]
MHPPTDNTKHDMRNDTNPHNKTHTPSRNINGRELAHTIVLADPVRRPRPHNRPC